MEGTGRPYADVLKDAQRLGYAEADPTSDVEGEDAAYKLALLARLAFGRDAQVGQIAREDHADPAVRLLCEEPRADAAPARCRARAPSGTCSCPCGRISCRAHPSSAKVTGPFNAIEEGRGGRLVRARARRGRRPHGDGRPGRRGRLARSTGEPRVPPLGFADLLPCEAASPAEFVSAYSLRFVVSDRPGIIADLAHPRGPRRNIEAVFQEP